MLYNSLVSALIGISFLFFSLLMVKQLFPVTIKRNFCVICSTITMSWAVLLILYYLGLFSNIILLSLLIGMTSLAIYYKLESKMEIFRLPLILTLITLSYLVISREILISSVYFLIFIWVLFCIMFLFKSNKKLNKLVINIIECCKKW